jgi:hypothetical protein
VSYAGRYGAYDRVVLADSSLLPLDDGEVDVSMSIENLEHLYPDDVVPALTELVRIARRRIVLTTPWPWDVVNVPWLTQELHDARLDPDPLGANEFHVLAGGVHKSTLLPEQLIAAGFTCMSITKRGTPRAHPVYVGEKSHVDLSAIVLFWHPIAVQIPPPNDSRDAYVEPIDASLRFREADPCASNGWYAALAVDRFRSAASRLH